MFLETIHGRHEIEGSGLVLFSLPNRKDSWIELEKVGESRGQCTKMVIQDAVKGQDIYFGVCPMRKPEPYLCTKKSDPRYGKMIVGRGRVEDVTALTCLWVDIDIESAEGHKGAKRRARDLEHALDVVRTIGMHGILKPSILVNSGGGLHAYWTLKEAWVFGEDGTREEADMMLLRWKSFCMGISSGMGVDLDAVFDMARILRVPGTVNRKYSPPRKVECLDIDGETMSIDDCMKAARHYNLDEIMNHIPDVAPQELALSGKKADRSAINARVIQMGDLVIDFAAEPPAAKLMEWTGDDVTIKRALKQNLPRLKDQSASGYEMYLANAAVKRGWSDQEIANLLISFRRDVGGKLEEKYSRHGFLASVIAKARAEMDGDTLAEDIKAQAEELRQSIVKVETAKKAAVEQSRGEDEIAPKGGKKKEEVQTPEVLAAIKATGEHRALMIKRIKNTLGIPVARWCQEGSTVGRERYSMILENGTIIPIGNASQAMLQRTFLGAVYVVTRTVMTKVKAKDWDAMLDALGAICEVHDSHETDEREEMLGFVKDYLGRMEDLPRFSADVRMEEDERQRLDSAIYGGAPHIRDGHVYITVRGLMRYINISVGDTSGTKSDVCRRIGQIGFSAHVVACKDGDGTTTRQFWKISCKKVFGRD